MSTYNAIKYNVDYAGFGGSLMPLLSSTASGDGDVQFTSKINSTYDSYVILLNNIHPATDNSTLGFNGSTDTGSNYNVAKTTTFFRTTQEENDSGTTLSYQSDKDLHQGTGDQQIAQSLGNDNDQSCSGFIQLFNPASTTFVKHFLIKINECHGGEISINSFIGGYFNTTSAIDAVRFKMGSGNLDAGTFQLFGVH